MSEQTSNVSLNQDSQGVLDEQECASVRPILVDQGSHANSFFTKILSLFLHTVVAAMLVRPCFVQGQSVPAPTSPAAPTTTAAPEVAVPAPIPLAEIATEAEAALARVRELLAEVPADSMVPPVMEQFPLLTREIDARLRQTRRILARRPSIEMLADLEEEWRPLRRNLIRWQRQLTTYLGRLEREIAELEELRKVWRETLGAGQAANIPAGSRLVEFRRSSPKSRRPAKLSSINARAP